MLNRLLKPFVFLFASLGLALLLAALLWFALDMEFYRRDSLTRSLSTFVSLQPANAWVITQLTNTETFEKVENHWVLEDYPVGTTRVSISLPATYHYYIKPGELRFQMEDRTLQISAGALHLLTPVGFDTQQVSQRGEKEWFGRSVDLVLTEVQQSVSEQLAQRGQQHLPLARKQAYEALSMNVHAFLLPLKQNDFYDEIVVSFSDDPQEQQQVFRFDKTARWHLPLGDGLMVVP